MLVITRNTCPGTLWYTDGGGKAKLIETMLSIFLSKNMRSCNVFIQDFKLGRVCMWTESVLSVGSLCILHGFSVFGTHARFIVWQRTRRWKASGLAPPPGRK